MVTTQSLEDVLRQVESLRGDLNAEIVVQEAQVHRETKYSGGPVGPDSYDERSEYELDVIDVPLITKPDTQKRESAKQELEKIMNSTESCCVRYITGIVLGIDTPTLVSQMQNSFVNSTKEYLENVYKTLSADSNSIWREEYEFVRREAGRLLGYSEGFILGDRLDSTRSSHIETLGKIYREGRNQVIREAAKRRLKDIMRSAAVNLERYYNLEDLRKAGKALGHSPLRIWTHENLETISEIVVVGVVSGLGYIIYQYLTK